MRIRHGFVSNSSSSSFLLVFDKKPESAIDVANTIWPGLSNIGSRFDCLECFPVSQAAEAVWSQIKGGKDLTLEELTREFRSDDSVIEGTRKYDRESWEEMDKRMNEQAAILAKAYKAEHKGKFICQVSFSDNDGPLETTLEHGDVFRKIENKTFSHH